MTDCANNRQKFLRSANYLASGFGDYIAVKVCMVFAELVSSQWQANAGAHLLPAPVQDRGLFQFLRMDEKSSDVLKAISVPDRSIPIVG